MDASQFRKVAIGTVAENLEILDENGKLNLICRVTPTEWLIRDGELTNQPVSMTFKSQDAQGVETQGGFITNQALPATWFPAGSNRRTPPNVRRGMRVELYQAANQAKFYWRYTGLDDHLMRLETIIFGINASPKEVTDGAEASFNPLEMYWFEMSSHSKKIALQTSKANGEPFAYEMFIDTAVGKWCACDDVGQFAEIVSKDHLVHLQNQDGAYVKLNKKDIEANAPADVIGDAARDIKLTAGQNITITAGQNLVAEGKVMATLKGGGSKFVLTAAGTVLTTPQVDYNLG